MTPLLVREYLRIEENYRKNVVVDNVPCTAYIIDTAGQVLFTNVA